LYIGMLLRPLSN